MAPRTSPGPVAGAHTEAPRSPVDRGRWARGARRAARGALGIAAVASVLALVLLGVGPRTGWYRTLVVLTESMEPAIPGGSVVLVTPMDPERIAVGQIVTYETPLEDRRVLTHRVVEILERGPHPVVRTKGDRNAAPDPWTARITGPSVWRVRLMVPFAGRAIQALRHPLLQRITVLGVPALLALVWLRGIWRRPRARAALSP